MNTCISVFKILITILIFRNVILKSIKLIINKEEYIIDLKNSLKQKINQDIMNVNYHNSFNSDDCILNITQFKTNFLIKPINKNNFTCNNLEKLKYNFFEINNKNQIEEYSFYMNNNNYEIHILNDTINFCGNVNKFDLENKKIKNFDFTKFNKNTIYNFSFNFDIENDEFTFIKNYNYNVCNNYFI